MASKRNLSAIGPLGRRPSRSLSNDPGAGRATAGLGATDVSFGTQFTVDKKQRLTIKKARSVQNATADTVQDTLNTLITNLRASGILES